MAANAGLSWVNKRTLQKDDFVESKVGNNEVKYLCGYKPKWPIQSI